MKISKQPLNAIQSPVYRITLLFLVDRLTSMMSTLRVIIHVWHIFNVVLKFSEDTDWEYWKVCDVYIFAGSTGTHHILSSQQRCVAWWSFHFINFQDLVEGGWRRSSKNGNFTGCFPILLPILAEPSYKDFIRFV